MVETVTSWVEKESREGSSGITIKQSEREINIEISKNAVAMLVSEIKCHVLMVRSSSRTL